MARAALALEHEVELIVNPWRSAALDTLGSSLRNQGRLTEACDVYERLLPEARTFYASDNVVLAWMELDAAAARQDLGRMDGVADTCTRTFGTLRARLGLAHPKSMGAFGLAVHALVREGRFDESRRWIADVRAELASGTETSAAQSATCTFWEGATALAEGRIQVAVEALRNAVAQLEPNDTQARTSFEAMLARALVGTSSGREEAVALATRCRTSSVGDARRVARYVLVRAALDERRMNAAEALLADGDPHASLDAPPPWPDAACDLFAAEIALARGAALEQVGPRLAHALDVLTLRLGPQHAELAVFRARAALATNVPLVR